MCWKIVTCDFQQADTVNLLVKYYKEAKHGIYLSNEEDEARGKRNENKVSQTIQKSLSVRMMEVKSKTRGGTRCCICFDPFSIQNISVIVFFCCHAYHATCLTESTSNLDAKKGAGETRHDSTSDFDYDNGEVEDDDEDDDEDDTDVGGPRMRCILCTTAAS